MIKLESLIYALSVNIPTRDNLVVSDRVKDGSSISIRSDSR